MQKQQEWNKLKNILCIRPDNIGDVIMTAPAIKALKYSVAGRKITLLASKAGAAIAKFIPEIDDVILFDTPWVKNGADHSGGEVKKIIEEIGKRKFDGAVIFTVYSQNPLPSAMICYMAGIPRIAGYCRENPYHLITEWIPDKEPIYEIKHEVERQLDLVNTLGAHSKSDELYLTISKSSESKILKDLKERGILPDSDYVLIHPGVSEERRQFSVEKFAETAQLIIEEIQYNVLVTGTAQESELTNYISQYTQGKAKSLAGKLTMEELIVVIKNAKVIISNNTGPVHIAAAVQTPVIVMYAMTNPQHAPWKVKHKIFPFDVSENMRSKNVVIDYAYHKSFLKKPSEIFPEEIVKAVTELVKAEYGKHLTKVLYL
jgi:lipopolysaccharide heptosyltransferase II